MKKQLREEVFNKYGGKCAYCGCELKKGWHVDHIEPKWHTWKDEEKLKKLVKVTKGSDGIDNLNPSCSRCNKWKSTFSIEQFREEIQSQIDRLKKYNSGFRMALDYGTIQLTEKRVKFYFEEYVPTSGSGLKVQDPVEYAKHSATKNKYFS